MTITTTGRAFDYSSGDLHYTGTLLQGSTEPSAAVVLLPDWRGQGALAHAHAADLVALGCTVVIADLYGDGFNPDSPDQVGPLVQRLLANREIGVRALAACVARLRQQVPSATPLVCVGYSAGGMVALDFGRSGAQVDGIVLCSALLKTAAAGMDARIRAPVLIVQGTQDQVSPVDVIDAVVAEMDATGNDLRLLLLSQTHHAFDNPEAGDDPNARLVYSAASAQHAKRAIAAFIAEVTAASKRA